MRSAKRSGESFSEVVRRLKVAEEPLTGLALKEFYRSGGSGVGEDYLNAVEQATRHDPIPENPWA